MHFQSIVVFLLGALSHHDHHYCHACTVFIVGKDATVDGSVLVSHSNDGEFETDPRLVSVPAMDYDPAGSSSSSSSNSQRPVYFSPENYPRYVGTSRGIPEYYPQDDQTEFQPIGFIPQVPHTFGYLEETYGAINEWQVAIGESTCSGVFGSIPLGAPNGTALFSIDELTHLAMERASTAREAIQLMGDLAEEYGFYGAGEFEGTAESLGVTDPNEAWIFHILPDPTGTSAIWAAQRIPDNGFAVLANMFVIREVDPNDKQFFLMSDSVHSVALEYQWWDPAEGVLLDFTKVYSDGEYSHKYYSGRRIWGAYHLAVPSQHFKEDYVDLQSDPVYPVYITPDSKLSVTDLFRFHRYSYQGTKYDLGAAGNLAAGPFGSPDRWKAGPGEAQVTGNWERPIGLYRTSDTYVVQSRVSSSLGGVLWFGPASALGTVFTPFLVDMDIPTSFRSGHHATFSRESAFWAACFVHNVANLKWSYAIKDIEERQKKLEQASVAMVQRMEAQYSQTQNFTAVEQAFLDNAASIVSSLWSLSDGIVFKYASGFVNEPPPNGMSQMVGYPAWWLQAVGYQDGPPPPPTQPKCCHPPKPSSSSSSEHATTSNGWTSPVLTGKVAMNQYLRATSEETL
jgi:dipeptidase